MTDDEFRNRYYKIEHGREVRADRLLLKRDLVEEYVATMVHGTLEQAPDDIFVIVRDVWDGETSD